jgi:YegS/Rv2252/BmrU family lipid kinase
MKYSLNYKCTMINEWLVIVNPIAGKGAIKQSWPSLEATLMNTLPIGEVAFSEYRGHAIELAKAGIEAGHHKILAVGGDGTNHEVVNGIMLQKRLSPSAVTYALLPVGTGNDWIKTHQIPRQLEKALAIIKKEKTTLQDVGLIHYHREGASKKRYFVNVAGMAYDAFICKYAEIRPEAVRNQLFYLWLVLKCLFRYRLRSARVVIDGQSYTDKYYTINVGIGRYSGGGMQLVPHAQPDDGQFAITLAGPLTKLAVLINTFRFYNGTIGNHPKVQLFKSNALAVEANEEAPTLVEADGEFLGQTPVRFELIPKALRVVVP